MFDSRKFFAKLLNVRTKFNKIVFFLTPLATIHHFVIYMSQIGELNPRSAAVISDCNNHNTVAAHSFIKPVVTYFKELCLTANIFHRQSVIVVHKARKVCQPN